MPRLAPAWSLLDRDGIRALLVVPERGLPEAVRLSLGRCGEIVANCSSFCQNWSIRPSLRSNVSNPGEPGRFNSPGPSPRRQTRRRLTVQQG